MKEKAKVRAPETGEQVSAMWTNIEAKHKFHGASFVDEGVGSDKTSAVALALTRAHTPARAHTPEILHLTLQETTTKAAAAEAQSKWKPVSKEVDWKKETADKKKEVDRRVGREATSSAKGERSRSAEVKVRDGAKRSGVKPGDDAPDRGSREKPAGSEELVSPSRKRRKLEEEEAEKGEADGAGRTAALEKLKKVRHVLEDRRPYE